LVKIGKWCWRLPDAVSVTLITAAIAAIRNQKPYDSPFEMEKVFFQVGTNDTNGSAISPTAKRNRDFVFELTAKILDWPYACRESASAPTVVDRLGRGMYFRTTKQWLSSRISRPLAGAERTSERLGRPLRHDASWPRAARRVRHISTHKGRSPKRKAAGQPGSAGRFVSEMPAGFPAQS
jgi:hypothetical protein